MLEREEVRHHGQEQNITEDEAALYDRQIRLWGLDAQRRLRGAQVLLVGVSGLGAEVAKNIILSGVKSCKLLDHSLVSQEDFCNQFLVERTDLGKNRAESSKARAQQLNPMVDVTADADNVKDKSEDFFTQFDIVCATCCQKQELIRINDICHKNNIQFYAGDVFGYYGYMFADLNEHEYAEEVPKKKDKSDEPAAKKAKTSDLQETVTVKKTESFNRFRETLDLDWSVPEKTKRLKRTPNTFFIIQVLLEFRSKHGRDPDSAHLDEDRTELSKLRESVLERLKLTNKDTVPQDFASYCVAELSPVCAVVGGVLGQEIIKAVSKKDKPHKNYFLFNGIDGSGMVDNITL